MGKVQIDLTVETKEVGRKHLGVISTKQTKEWLKEMPTLQSIAIIMKYQLADKMLN
jgi:DNA polymerase sigma